MQNRSNLVHNVYFTPFGPDDAGDIICITHTEYISYHILITGVLWKSRLIHSYLQRTKPKVRIIS